MPVCAEAPNVRVRCATASSTVVPQEGLCERFGRCREPVGLEPQALGKRALSQGVEVDLPQPMVTVSDLRKREPQRALALDAGCEAFELEEAGQWGVALDLSVQLQAPELLGRPRDGDLRLRAGDSKFFHQLEKGFLVFDDLREETAQDLPELAPRVLLQGTSRELDCHRRARKVVIQVDRQEA